jgi:hypothetical protein
LLIFLVGLVGVTVTNNNTTRFSVKEVFSVVSVSQSYMQNMHSNFVREETLMKRKVAAVTSHKMEINVPDDFN